jgi:hypothetical protein
MWFSGIYLLEGLDGDCCGGLQMGFIASVNKKAKQTLKDKAET